MARKKSVKRKQCAIEGCRKSRLEGSTACRNHQDEAPPDPMAEVKRLSELDRLKFVELDTFLMNHTLEIKNITQAEQIEQHEYRQRQLGRQARLNELRASIKVRTAEQRQMLGEMGEKYAFDPAKSSIDDKTGVIQEHPGD